MLHIEFLVEEESMQAALKAIAPRLLSESVTWEVFAFQGQQDLFKRLPRRLLGYARRVRTETIGVVVLIDEDREGCRDLKARLERLSANASLATKTKPLPTGRFHVLNRIAIEELEAWFFGDERALRSAYPRLPDGLTRRAEYRDPDAINGGTWERLHAELKAIGLFPAHFPKIEVARAVAPHLDPARNRSRSFQTFLGGLEALVAQARPAA
jgi:hypothetical protein